MPRTFSLARLMLGITLFCVVCGLAVNYPIAAVILAPTCLVWFGVTRIVTYRGGLTVTCLLGAGLGFFPAGLLAEHVATHHLDDWWRLPAAVVILGSGPAIGALIFSGSVLFCEHYLKRRRAS
jgi:hypothetical protein